MKEAAAAGALLRQLLTRWGLDRKLREYRAWEVWDEVVGPQIAARARPAKLRDGVLDVLVDQPVWMQQLQLMKPKILSRLNARLDDAIIRDIYWRRGRMAHAGPGGPPRRASAARHALPLDEDELATIERVLTPLSDPAVKESLRAVLQCQAQLTKTRSVPHGGNSEEKPSPISERK